MERRIHLPLTPQDVKELCAGDYVYLTGEIYTARDAAHKRMIETLDRGESLPLDMKGAVIYYLGPSPAREGRVIGSAGPTTSSRMDRYTAGAEGSRQHIITIAITAATKTHIAEIKIPFAFIST